MTRAELTDRVIELFPPLAEVKPWDWGETDEGEPVVLNREARDVHRDGRRRDRPTAPIPNTAMVGVWRIDLSNHDKLVGLADDPLAKAAEQAPRN